jgi:Protein of unknown function (DUF2026)
MASRRLLLPLPDYERIYRLITGVLDGNGNTPRACVFFSAVGCALLEQNYKVKADFRGGGAAYAMATGGDKLTVSHFGRVDDAGALVSDTGAFHCWVEAEGYAIDFMAPLFEASMRAGGHQVSIPPRMFQRPLAEMAPSVPEVRTLGDFHLARSPELELEVFGNFGRLPMNGDLANIALHWFRRPPKELPRDMAWRDNEGNQKALSLKGPRLVGAW